MNPMRVTAIIGDSTAEIVENPAALGAFATWAVKIENWKHHPKEHPRPTILIECEDHATALSLMITLTSGKIAGFDVKPQP